MTLRLGGLSSGESHQNHWVSVGCLVVAVRATVCRFSAAVEDPFDATDNCARTIGISRIDCIVDAFGNTAAVMNAVRDNAGDHCLASI